MTKADTVELENIAPTKSAEDDDEVKAVRTTQQSFTIAADDMKNEITIAATQNQTESQSDEVVVAESPQVTQQNEGGQEAEGIEDNAETEGEEADAKEGEIADTEDVVDTVENVDSDENVDNIDENVDEGENNLEVQNDEENVETEPIATKEENNEEVQGDIVDENAEAESDLDADNDSPAEEIENEAQEEVADSEPEEIQPNEDNNEDQVEEMIQEIPEEQVIAEDGDSEIEIVKTEDELAFEGKPEDHEDLEVEGENKEPVEGEPDQLADENPDVPAEVPEDNPEGVPENVVETISDVNLEVPEINEVEDQNKAHEDINEGHDVGDLVVAETGDTVGDTGIANSPVKSMMDDFAADLNGRLDDQPSDPAGVVLPDDYEAKSPLSPIIAPEVPEIPEVPEEPEGQANEEVPEPEAVLHEPEKDEEPIKSPEPMGVIIETPNISNEKLDAELDGFDKLNQQQQEAVLEFVKSKLAKEKEVLQEGLADKALEPALEPVQIPAEPVLEAPIEDVHPEENGRMEDDEEDDFIEDVIEPVVEPESDELDKIIDNNAESPAELDKSLYEDENNANGVEYHYENNYDQAVGDGKALSWYVFQY